MMSAENLKLNKPFFRYLDINGDGTGNKAVTGNYAGEAEEFYLEPAAGQVFICHRMIVGIEDSTGMDVGAYGNGITLTQDGSVIDLLDGLPIKTNGHWAKMCHDVELRAWGTGNDIITVRWTFTKSGPGLRLIGNNNDKLSVTVEDNYSGLLDHKFMVEGHMENTNY